SVATTASATVASSSSTAQPFGRAACLSTPEAMVALPCGSRSTSSTRRFAAASAAARFTLVVVLPTPPFWLATARMRAISAARPAKNQVTLGLEERHVQLARLPAFPSSGQRRELLARIFTLHRNENARGRDQMP